MLTSQSFLRWSCCRCAKIFFHTLRNEKTENHNFFPLICDAKEFFWNRSHHEWRGYFSTLISGTKGCCSRTVVANVPCHYLWCTCHWNFLVEKIHKKVWSKKNLTFSLYPEKWVSFLKICNGISNLKWFQFKVLLLRIWPIWSILAFLLIVCWHFGNFTPTFKKTKRSVFFRQITIVNIQ